MSDNYSRINSIDGLKGLSACVIAFLWHYRHFVDFSVAPFNHVFFFSYRFGDNLVELFFMLSGFGLMLGYGEKIINHNVSFPIFIKKRLNKLYPLFIVTTIFVCVMEYIIHKLTGEFFVYPNFDLYHFVLNLLMLQNGAIETIWSFNSPSWVISVLMLLYCLFYFICYISKDLHKVYYIFAVGVLVGFAIILKGDSYPFDNSLFGRGLASFSLGVLLYGIIRLKEKTNYKLVCVLCIAFIAVSYILIRLEMNDYVGNIKMLFILGIWPMLIYLIVLFPLLNKLLSFKPFVILGKMSFPIYLLHFPIQCILKLFSSFYSINFRLKFIWLIYIFATMLIAGLYTFLISDKFESRFFQLFKSSKVKIKL